MRLVACSLQSGSLALLVAGLAGCPSDPTPVVDSASGSSDGSTGSTESTGSVEPDPGSSTSTSSHGTSIDDTGTEATAATGTEDSGTTVATTGDTSTTDDSGTSDTGEPVAICGDGIVSDDEACDDAGESDACNADCTPAICGDGLVNATASEDCDDGGESALCNIDCSLAACGDGLLNATAGELCDEVGRTAACNPDCSLASCGDGVLNVLAGEDCDDGGESALCNIDCSLTACGDGITNLSAGEDCDDAGESVSCDTDCTTPTCGDSLVNALAGELCEGVVPPDASCQTLGFTAGTLACGAGCEYDASGCADPPGPPTLELAFSAIKRFDFSWAAVPTAEHYELLESMMPGDPHVSIASGIVGESLSLTMPLHLRAQASYVLRACNVAGCADSAEVSVTGTLAEAVGFFKASNPAGNDLFGGSVALSADGSTLAVGAYNEGSNATGVGGDQLNNAAQFSGAVYVFVRDAGGQWSQQAYVKASNTGAVDQFGWIVSLSDDGDTLAVGAYYEDSNATGVDGNQANDGLFNSGAAYVFARDGAGQWSQQAYVKASNTNAVDVFGWSVAISGDGDTLAVGAYAEDGNGTGTTGDPSNNLAGNSGAVYVYVRSGMGQWSQQAYVKASNTGGNDQFGWSVALSTDGDTLAVGADLEDGGATGIDGNQASNAGPDAGAVYVFVRDGADQWSQQAYVKASNTGSNDHFGHDVTLSGDGDTLAVGAYGERSIAMGIDGNQADDSAMNAGAAYVFARDAMGQWSQQAYVKPSNTTANDYFAYGVSLSANGDVLAVGSYFEDGDATGVGGSDANDLAADSGATYVYLRDIAGTWSQHAYVKPSTAGPGDFFGRRVAISDDAMTLAVGTLYEDSNATGIGGDQGNNVAMNSGAVHVF